MPTPRSLPTVAALALCLVCLFVALPSLAAEPVEKAGPNILYVLAADVGRLLDVLERPGLAPTRWWSSPPTMVFHPPQTCRRLRPSAPIQAPACAAIRQISTKGAIACRWSCVGRGMTPAGSRSDQLVCHAYLLATCADLLDATLPADAADDSLSMPPLLGGQAEGTRKSCIMHSSEGRFGIREG